ncbi:MAG: TIGR03960 family B12-binding radical SAM protein [Nitrospirae bacterium]|nr:TIGR03960 family B12-binding radical SAM protein [Nitrospirota bacterium]
MDLSFFQKPSRYINSEYNAVEPPGAAARKDDVRFLLAFPDTYEVGMSHLGLKILYDILNSLPFASAQRCFAPWPDLEAHMKSSSQPLAALESRVPIRDFDIIGFSLQYELSYTTVLNMLSLGGVPLHAAERLDIKGHVPFVVAGGPCTVNPAPMGPFIDAFLIGDGEGAVIELAQIINRWKKEGDGRRESVLREIAALEGFYVPAIHGAGQRIHRRIVDDLDSQAYPVKPVVPYTSIVHDRINIEVSRGCPMGCRFCQAGMIYRPLRERRPETVLRLAEESLRNTGYDEISLVSLSAGDYSCLLPVIKEFNAGHGNSGIAVSLPSLRVKAIDRSVLREIRSVRKTGFTIAPEAATDRLRAVINKDFTSDDYEQALRALFEEGWLNLKLYFMVGLPTETDEDIEAIGEMAASALKIARKSTGKFVNVSVTVSPFVPKTHTPFQWCGQISLDEMKRKLGYLRQSLGSRKLKYKGHDERTSFLEGAFARGDEHMSRLIEAAWGAGCRLDGWSEHFDFSLWSDAMNKTGIDCAAYAERVFGRDEQLPWDIIDIGVKKDFLYKEYERALAVEKTASCTESCTSCGLRCPSSRRTGIPASEGPAVAPIRSDSARPKLRVRVQFSKLGMLRYLSHLELATAVLRGLRRAGVRFDVSKGFHPAPRVAFGPSLSVGIAGEREYFDVEVFSPFDIEFYRDEINRRMPEEIRIGKMAVIPTGEPSLSTFVTRYEYVIKGLPAKDLPSRVEGGRYGALIAIRDGKEIDISPCIEEVSSVVDGGSMDIGLLLRDQGSLKARVGEVAETLFGGSFRGMDITRTAYYGWKDGWVEPL